MRTCDEIEAIRRALGMPPAFANGGPPPKGDLSTNALEVLAKCPKQYEHKYLLKTPKGPYGGSTEAMRLGGVVHRILFECRGFAGMAGSPLTRKALLDLCASKSANPREAKAAYEILRPILAKLSFEHAVAFEEPIRLKFDGGELTGQADRIDSTPFGFLEVWDYKTGEDVRDDHETDPQTLGYLGSLHEETGAVNIVFKHWYLVPDVVVVTKFDPDTHAMYLTHLAQRRAEIVNSNQWPATPGRACFDCPYQSVCDERAKALSDQIPKADTPFFLGDDDELLKRRQFLKSREELANGMRTQLDADAIRPRLAAGRKVIGGGLVAGLRSCRATKHYPNASVVLQELAKLGTEPLLDASALNSVPFEKAGLERWLRGLGTEEEKRAREALEKLATFDEGGSYVEVRRT